MVHLDVTVYDASTNKKRCKKGKKGKRQKEKGKMWKSDEVEK
jgi:hypothetical protein